MPGIFSPAVRGGLAVPFSLLLALMSGCSDKNGNGGNWIFHIGRLFRDDPSFGTFEVLIGHHDIIGPLAFLATDALSRYFGIWCICLFFWGGVLYIYIFFLLSSLRGYEEKKNLGKISMRWFSLNFFLLVCCELRKVFFSRTSCPSPCLLRLYTGWQEKYHY